MGNMIKIKRHYRRPHNTFCMIPTTASVRLRIRFLPMVKPYAIKLLEHSTGEAG